MNDSNNQSSSIAIESGFVTFTYLDRCINIFIVKNNGSKPIKRGNIIVRAYDDNLVILGDFTFDTGFEMSPREKSAFRGNLPPKTRNIHVRHLEERESDLKIVIDEWFTVSTSPKKLEGYSGWLWSCMSSPL